MKILIAGDYYPNNRARILIEKNTLDVISDDVRSFVKSADYSIVNYESPVVESTEEGKISKVGPNLQSSRQTAKFLYDVGFKMATLANNHTLDYGGVNLLKTKACLEDIGFDTIGAGINLEDAGVTKYIKIRGRDLAIINCCEHEFSIASDKEPGANPLNPVKQFYNIQDAKNKSDFVIVIVHGGVEHCQLPSQRMVETYRFFIDAGANVVVNHHQHCYSGYETYHNGLIFYGLGNFCFDSFDAPHMTPTIWNEGFLLNLEITDEELEFEMVPYIQCADKPSVELMKSKDKEHFFQTIKQLNHIIADRETLQTELVKWYDTHNYAQRIVLLPYRNRLLRALAIRGFLPDSFNIPNVRLLYNQIELESHRERLLHYLENKLK